MCFCTNNFLPHTCMHMWCLSHAKTNARTFTMVNICWPALLLTTLLCVVVLAYSQDLPPFEECVNEGEVQLTNVSQGENPFFYAGRLQVCYQGAYGGVCDLGWDEADAAVVCRSLDFGPPMFRELLS